MVTEDQNLSYPLFLFVYIYLTAGKFLAAALSMVRITNDLLMVQLLTF